MSSERPQSSGQDTDRARAAIAIIWVECAIAIVVVLLRIWSRYLIRNLGADDWMMLFSLVLLIICCSFTTHYASLGGFRHLYYLLESGVNTMRITFINYILQVCIIFSYAPAKTSVALLVLRIIGPKKQTKHGAWRRWLIIGMLVLVWGATIPNCIMIYLQCSPVEALWDPSISREGCWDPELLPHYAFFTSSVNIWADAVLAVIPASLIWKLNMDLKKRVTLCVLLGLGVLSAICAIVKTTYLSDLGMLAKNRITRGRHNLLLWAISELFVLIFCGSLVTLKPFWDRMRGSKITYGSSGPTNRANIFSQSSAHSADVVRGNMPAEPVQEGDIRAVTDIEVHLSREWNAF